MFWLIVAIVLFCIVLPTIYFKNKLKADIQGIFTLWKTKRGLKVLKDLARFENFWKWFADLGIIISFGLFGFYFLIKNDKRSTWKYVITYIFFVALFLLIAFPAIFTKLQFPSFDILFLLIFGAGPFLFYLLIQQTWSIILGYINGLNPLPGIAPIIPGVDIPGSPIKVPLSALFGFVLLLFVHEGAHGIVAMVQKIKVKSLGILTLGIFPLGAFTEPDEEQLKKEKMLPRMRVFSAGSMANFSAAACFLLLFFFLTAVLTPTMQNMTSDAELDYMTVGSVLPDSPASFANVTTGMKVYNAHVLLYPDKTQKEVVLETENGLIKVDRNKEGLIGLASDYRMAYKNINPLYWPIFYSIEAIYWTYLLNFLVGIFNFLPVYMLDGGYLFQDLAGFYARKFKIKKPKTFATKAFTATSVAVFVMILINALPYFF